MAKQSDNNGRKGVKISKELIIGALALRCPNRKGSGVFYRCDCGDGHPTNCNPRLCMHTISFFDDMVAIAKGEKQWE